MSASTRDDERFEREALCWLPDVARYALSLTRDEANADDLVQDTFVLAYEKWAQFQAGTECRAWLFTICRNRFYRSSEREDREYSAETPELEALAAAAIHASAMSSGLDDAFERQEILGAIESAIAELPSAFREVAQLIDLHDHSYESASNVLGVPIGTIRSRLFRARRLLQQQLLAHARDLGIAGATQTTRHAMKPMIDCDAVMRQLWDYLDDELTAERMEAIRDHLTMCGRCQPQAEFERAFLLAVEKARREHSHPADLAQHVRSALAAHGYSVT